jgi:hypothetical protein
MNSSVKILNYLLPSTILGNNKQVIKNNNINGTWKIRGNFLDHHGYNVESKKISFTDYNYNFIINQDSEKSEFFIVHSIFNENDSITKGISYQPGIIINTNPLTINITDYDDNGIFRLVEKERASNDLVISFTGYYIESGFSKDNIFQRPSVGSFTMEKQSDNNIINIVQSTLPQNKVQNLRLASNQLYYSVYNLHETVQENKNNYVITFVGPLLNSSNQIIGYIETENTYSISQGITYCDANAVYNIYDDVHNDDYNKYGKHNKYFPPENIKLSGSLGIIIHYQGTLSQSKFMTGNISTILSKREGDVLPQTFAPVSLTIKGRTDAIRIVTCDDLVHLISKST